MKRTLMCATAAAAMASAGNVAVAQDGWYGRADLGYTFDGTLDHDAEPGSLYSLGGDSDLDGGLPGISAGIGYGFENGFRIEGVAGWRAGSLDPDGVINGGPPVDTASLFFDPGSDGKISVIDFMVNGLYDFMPESSFNPYVGAGVGISQVKAKAFSLRAADVGGNTSTVNGFSDEDAVLAYQFLAGIGYDITEQLILDIGYKYYTTDDL
ncbi:outer membrane protein, partial [Henriciella mobilis]